MSRAPHTRLQKCRISQFSIVHPEPVLANDRFPCKTGVTKGGVALTLKDKCSRDMLVKSASQCLNAAARCSATHCSSAAGRPGVRQLVSIFRVRGVGVVCDCGDAVLEPEA
jgi:hypothetical protein